MQTGTIESERMALWPLLKVRGDGDGVCSERRSKLVLRVVEWRQCVCTCVETGCGSSCSAFFVYLHYFHKR